MADVNKLVFAILQFLESQSRNSQIGEEAVESIEVAIQCLETAYGVSTRDELIAEQLTTNRSLLEIFNTATGAAKPISANVSVTIPESASVDDLTAAAAAAPPPGEASSAATAPPQEVPAEVKAEAEKLKTEGNNLMKNERYQDAVECYTKALGLDSGNAVYYSNRAAAYSKLEDHVRAIQDCEQAVGIDPGYSKAYGRMGLAFTSLNQLEKAKEAYAKAVNLEPSNDSYQTNLQIAEQKLREASLGGGPPGAGGFPFGGLGGGLGGPTLGGMDVGQVLQNPGLMNMAAQFMQNPQMQQMMQSMMSQSMQPPAASAETAEPAMDGESFANLLQVGQNLASQIQQSNPELIEQLRQMRQSPPGEGDDDPTGNPDSNGNTGGDGPDSSPAS